MGSACYDDENIISLLDSTSFSNEAKMVVDFIANYYDNIENYPVRSQVKPGYLKKLLPSVAPDGPETMEDILNDVSDSIIPGLTHWQSPNFFGYFPINASNAGFIGEMLCSGLNVVNFCWIASPAGTELESIVMDWMGNMLKLPSSFLFSGTGGGVLHGSTCEAVVCTIAAARDKALKKHGDDKITKMVVYASDQSHSTFEKGSKLVGILPSNFRVIPTSSSSGFSFSVEALRSEIEQDIKQGLIPLFLCATVGTTACNAVDPIKELGEVANKYEMWLHIDAAYSGSACICPEFRHYLDGVELADSFSMNPHKWFLTNMDCCCLWLKQPKAMTDSLGFTPEYLKNKATESASVIDYKDWQIALSRRFRAIKLWVVIRRYGLVNLRSHIRSGVKLAKKFESLVMSDKRFEVVVPTRFSLVCFRLKPNEPSEVYELNRKLLDSVNSSGRAFMTHGVVGGIYFIRCAIGAAMTKENHIDELWKLIQEKAQCVLDFVVAKD